MSDRDDDRLTTDAEAPKGRNGARGRFATDSRDAGERSAGERERGEREHTQDRDLSDADRLELFRDAHTQSVMPDLPQKDGYHNCWLTTSNPRDTIARRLQLGYELIRVEDLPSSYQNLSPKQGEYSGMVMVNEMVAARISLRLYNLYMREVHERLPLAEEGKLRASVEGISAQAEQVGGKITAGDGTERIVQRAPPMPEFRA